jgi:hypothetical protein
MERMRSFLNSGTFAHALTGPFAILPSGSFLVSFLVAAINTRSVLLTKISLRKLLFRILRCDVHVPRNQFPSAVYGYYHYLLEL